MEINIIGHKNPDTDAVVGSLVLADLLKKTKKPLDFGGLKIEAKITGDLNKETRFVLKRFKQDIPALIKSAKNKKVFLVDHGGSEESIEGIREAEIIGVLDHHRLDGLKTVFPIFYRAEPLGASSTILAKIFLENNISFSKKQAGLLLAGILSDTLNLTSPTTTKEDQKMVIILSRVSKEKSTVLAKKMFKEKSDISDISIKELIKKDYKEFKAKGIKFGIGVWETTNPEKIKEKKLEILSALELFKRKSKISLIFFASVDILKGESELYLPSVKEIKTAEKVFGKKASGNSIFLPGVVSRKKQILPLLIKFLENS